MKKHNSSFIIFRRFRKDRNGKVLDAHAYGHLAWPIRISYGKAKKK